MLTDRTPAQQRGKDVLDGLILDLHSNLPTKPNERIMAEERLSTVDVLAGTFFVTDTSGKEKALDFYVRTCSAREDSGAGSEEARSKRQDDLNEQYVDVSIRLMLRYSERIRYVRVMPDPFF